MTNLELQAYYQRLRQQQIYRAYAAWYGGRKEEPKEDDKSLCFTAIEDSSVDMFSFQSGFNPPESHIRLQYRLNDGMWTEFDWSSFAIDQQKTSSTGYLHTTTEISIPKGSKLYVRSGEGGNQYISHHNALCNVFLMNGSLTVSGDLTSILSREENVAIGDFCFNSLFGAYVQNGVKVNTDSLKYAHDLFLPSQELGKFSCNMMFHGNTNLKTPPHLPSTLLGIWCYKEMFYRCKQLTIAPQLPSLTLWEGCYEGMFGECESLTDTPQLPSVTLAASCYNYMFYCCTSLSSATSLPAPILRANCYQEMFCGCTNLNEAPLLPAISLASNCYTNMFVDCDNITECHMKQKSQMVEEYNPSEHGELKDGIDIHYDIP